MAIVNVQFGHHLKQNSKSRRIRNPGRFVSHLFKPYIDSGGGEN